MTLAGMDLHASGRAAAEAQPTRRTSTERRREGWSRRLVVRTKSDGDGREGGARDGDGARLQLRPFETATPACGGV